ncbi:site-specific DNA-methyltransferase [Microbacterium sp.]|uniref:site-specific DNA-methyltransferase n=1 Tax=Microbacterium sp. TaxID=51671 RepID=UPI0025DA9548|nr:site-specific DNA-methyltransferase [Microbacterium sp.]MBT9605933.1 site-specific DNA-methyltransferase [Microbacterium sp.]
MPDDIYETPSTTQNFQTELAAQLADLIPEAIADGKVDVEKLKELLDGDAADSSERFGLFWPGKKRALRAAQEPTTATLKPDFDNSKDWDSTQNVFIEGDNLEVLKILQKHYHAKIKLIYIDPPYNTGKDFVYPDNYKEGLDTYLEWTRQVNEEGKKVSTNAETEGRYHSNWLNMMYPRLKLARNLLTDDGVIFISIDDNEVDNLVKVGNEVFGEANFLGTIVWNHSKQTKNDEPFLASNHNYVVMWRRSAVRSLLRAPRTEENNRNYSNPDSDPRGEWRSGDVRSPSFRATLRYEITTPSGKTIQPPDNGWRWSRDQVLSKIESGEIVFSADETRVIRKIYLADQAGRIAESIWPGETFGTTRSANAALKELFDGQVYFDTPKPTELIAGIARLFSQDDDYKNFTILDFFSGSGTTAEAVMQLNAEDDGQRRHLQVQLPEPTGEASAARAAGLATIADISRERIRLAGDRIAQEIDSRLDDGSLRHPDTGFRSYKLSDTNFSKWRLSSDVDEDALQQHLLSLRDSATDDATADELLTEILLKQGYSLTEAVSPAEVGGLDVRLVRDRDGDVAVLAYLNEQVKPTLEQLRALVDEAPTRIVVLEDAFQGDDELKTNLAQLAKSKGIELWTA